MVGKVHSAAVLGISAEIIEVEADVCGGFPSFEMTGNLGKSAKEAKNRVYTAIKNSKIKIGPSKITVNMSPANIRKEGPHFDLAVAIAVLCAGGVIENRELNDILFIGELGLEGQINPVKAVFPMLLKAVDKGYRICIIPKQNENEARYVRGILVIGITSLSECVAYLRGIKEIQPVSVQDDISGMISDIDNDFDEIKGQKALKRAAAVAAASMHNILMIGPPGGGKTMTASRIISLMPPPTGEQCIEITKVYSVAGLLNNGEGLITKRPFRAPHHTITAAAMAGGGAYPVPGEISLAQHGILFLDELNLFDRRTIETLRSPMEKGTVTIDRVYGKYEYPGNFMLAAAMNPCKCGYYPDRNKCRCTQSEINRYFGRISRPILDRIDICVWADRVEYDDLKKDADEKNNTAAMRKKVMNAYKLQEKRYENCIFKRNSCIPDKYISEYCVLEKDAEQLIKSAFDKYDLTARGYKRTLKVARTIADMENHDRITVSDVAEAVGYRMVENG